MICNRCNAFSFDKYYHKAYSTSSRTPFWKVNQICQDSCATHLLHDMKKQHVTWHQMIMQIQGGEGKKKKKVNRTEALQLVVIWDWLHPWVIIKIFSSTTENQRGNDAVRSHVFWWEKVHLCAIWSQAEWFICLLIHSYIHPMTRSKKVIQSGGGGDPASLKKQLMGGMRTMWHMFSHRFLW